MTILQYLLDIMFAEFSSGYYVGRLYVEPHDRETAVIQRDQHSIMNEQLYATGTGIERLDHPLVMKLDRKHFPVHGDPGIPENTLALPHSVVDGCRIGSVPSVQEIFLAKADRAAQLLEFFGFPPYDVGT